MKSKTILPACLLLLVAACNRDPEAEFGTPRRLAAEQRPTIWDAPARDRLGLPDMSGTAQQTAGAGTQRRIVGKTPAGWEELPAEPQRFREALWRVAGQPDTECYLTTGVGGGVAGNMRRWYGQFGVDEVPSIEALPVVELAGRAGRLVELRGVFNGQKPGYAMLLGFYADGDRVTTLKFTGPESVVTGNREQFLALAASLRTATVGPDPGAPPIRPDQPLPDGHPPLPAGAGGAAQPAASSDGVPFTAAVPAEWSPKVGSPRFLHHTFGSGGEVYISQLGGTLKPTIDIWRGELGLGPSSPAEFAALPRTLFLGDDAVLVDLTGTFRSMSSPSRQIDDARVLIAARLDGSTITFCKLVGPRAEVDQQADAFQRFCGSVRRAP